jgi:hypothetical protein
VAIAGGRIGGASGTMGSACATCPGAGAQRIGQLLVAPGGGPAFETSPVASPRPRHPRIRIGRHPRLLLEVASLNRDRPPAVDPLAGLLLVELRLLDPAGQAAELLLDGGEPFCRIATPGLPELPSGKAPSAHGRR